MRLRKFFNNENFPIYGNFKSGKVQRLFEGGYYSRVAFIMYIPVNCQNSGRGQSKRAHTADDRFDKAISSYQLHVSGQPLCWNAARHSQKPSA